MGGTRWSDSAYTARSSYRAATSTPVFAYSADISSGKVAAKVHDKLNPNGVKFRESRDSDANPNSLAVGVLLDVTGSMREVPAMIQQNLPKLMGLLQRKGYISDPHILVGAIGDATCDNAPLQVGQFEAGIEIDDDISNLYLEGGGGGSMEESYELGMYFMARHTSIDCYEKRGKKGMLFLVGDEKPYPTISRLRVKEVIGDTLQADIPTEEIVKELQEKYEVFFINPNMTSYFGRAELRNTWEKLLPQRFLELQDPNGICELIASTAAMLEGFELDEVKDHLKEAGTDLMVSEAVAKAVAKVKGKGRAISVPTTSESSGLV